MAGDDLELEIDSETGEEEPTSAAEGTSEASPGSSSAEGAPAESTPASQDLPPDLAAVPPTGPRLIALAAGRGGAGRSLVAANIAVYLAQTGKKVVAIDADPAGGPLHQLLGAPRPLRGYGEFLRGRVESLGELVVDTPVAGVGLIGGEGSSFGATKAKSPPRAALSALRRLDADYVVVDLGPPDSTATLDIWLAAELPVALTLPDPASIEATYRFVKSAFLRKLRTTRGLERLVPSPAGPPPAALDLYRAARAAEPEPVRSSRSGRDTGDRPKSGGAPTLAERLAAEMRAYRPRFIVNQTRALADLKLGVWMASAAQRRLGHPFEYLGHLEWDETVWVAARRRRPLVAEYPEAKVAKNIERIARRLLSADTERPPSWSVAAIRTEDEQTFYEILETEPGVSDEEVRRAYRTLKEIYAPSSLVIAGLYDEHELAELHARANAAHDTLFSPERRRTYDLSLPEADLARAARAAAQHARRARASVAVPDRSDTPDPILAAGGEVTGAILRSIRESRGLELTDISQRTKISERHLRSLEEERFGDMPAPVYVRGFITEYARALRLDPQRTAEAYLRRYNAAAGGNLPPAPER